MKLVEYTTTKSGRCTKIGVEEMLVPVRPKGFGWMLCATHVIWDDTMVYWWWRINPFQRR